MKTAITYAAIGITGSLVMLGLTALFLNAAAREAAFNNGINRARAHHFIITKQTLHQTNHAELRKHGPEIYSLADSKGAK